MIESPAFEIIKQIGYEEGLKAGIQQGIQHGIQQGLLEAIELGLKLKFGAKGLKLYPKILKIKDVEKLKTIKKALEFVEKPEELEEFLKD